MVYFYRDGKLARLKLHTHARFCYFTQYMLACATEKAYLLPGHGNWYASLSGLGDGAHIAVQVNDNTLFAH